MARFKFFRSLPPVLLPGLILLLALAATGCGRNKHVIEFDRRFSMNLAPVPDWFGEPSKDAVLGPAEQEVITRQGRPDFIRFWWRPDGSLITSSDLAGKTDQLPQMLVDTQRSWLYTREGKEVQFFNDGASYRVVEIPEAIKLIARYGDPTLRNPAVVRGGHSYETWIWMDHGVKVTLMDSVPIKTEYLPATGSGTWIGK